MTCCNRHWIGLLTLAMAVQVVGAEPPGENLALTKTETFDRDPGWDHFNNRPADRRDQPVVIRQDFGFDARTSRVGGFIQAAAEPAYFGKAITDASLQAPLKASGTIAVADGGTHLLLGFFNSSTVNEWRTPNTIAIRIHGRGDHFLAYVEYCTSKWRAGGDEPQSFATAVDAKTGRKQFVGFPSGGKVHRWSLAYDPAGAGGAGVITATIDDQTAICNLGEGHRSDGVRFNRFGLLNVLKSADGGNDVYLDDVTINGQAERFAVDPKWEGKGNRTSYKTFNVPRASILDGVLRGSGGAADDG